MALFTLLQELNLPSSSSKGYDEQVSLQGWLQTIIKKKRQMYIRSYSITKFFRSTLNTDTVPRHFGIRINSASLYVCFSKNS